MNRLKNLFFASAAFVIPLRVAHAQFDPKLAALSAQNAVNPAYGFIPDAGLQARYLLNECVGSTATPATVVDATGNFPVTPPSSNPPVCGGDGSLVFTANTTSYMNEPAGLQITNGGTIEMVFSNAVTTTNPQGAQFPQLFGYTGANPAFGVGLRPNYAGSGTQGFGTKWLAYQEVNSGGTSLAQVGSLLSAVDNGLFVVGVTWSPTGQVTEYLNGVVVPQFNQSSAAWAAQTATGGNFQWGGVSVGTTNCAANSGYCNFGGKVYGISFSTTQASAAIEANNYLAWINQAKNKGAVSSPYYGASNVPGVLNGIGESWEAGHGLASVSQSFTNMAASYLSASTASGGLGVAITAQADGNDNNTGFNISGYCARTLHALSVPGTGVRLAVLMGHGNSAATAGVTDGSQGLSGQLGWPGVTSTVNAAIQDAAEFSRCARQAADDGYIVAIGGATSGLSTPTSYSADTRQKDTYNPVLRQYAASTGALVVDFANDPRIGADGAAASGGYGGGALVNNCVLDAGGPAVPAYLGDGLHAAQCGAQINGHQLAAVYAFGLNRKGGSPPSVVSSASANVQLMNQIGDNFVLSAAGATMTIEPVSGLPPGSVIATVTNTSGASDTITLGTDYNGGPQNTLADGSTTSLSLAAGATKRLVVGPVNDTTGIAYVLVI